MTVGIPEIEDATNVGMPDCTSYLDLASEPFDPALFLGPIRPQDLEGDRLPQDPVPGAKDLAAPPFADRSLDLKSRIDDGARLDSGRFSTVGPPGLDGSVDVFETSGSNVGHCLPDLPSDPTTPKAPEGVATI
jgi:hypothetical protein